MPQPVAPAPAPGAQLVVVNPPPLSTRVRFRVAGRQATLLQQLAKPRAQPPANGVAEPVQPPPSVASQEQEGLQVSRSSQQQPSAQHMTAARKGSGPKEGVGRKPSQQSMLAFAVPKRPHPSSTEQPNPPSQPGTQSQGQHTNSASLGQQSASVQHTGLAPANLDSQGGMPGNGHHAAPGMAAAGMSGAQMPQPEQQAGAARNEAAKNVWQVSECPCWPSTC
jgi:hypothetical protein